ncbi:hypothetical protein G8O24_21260 [Bradyrhizobium sp. INPA01-394B]|uniref:Uncharacterized protein n=1 Tax=Bradyrhizobium campsiandrae TaxID=1729892 RepID=A0ABR7U404_9BRAD|nr:hypothetical protein [Bradyrhizobium campsiandrae]MBC9879873.1 hypothetical protein [Bradyrhizobium campsiandrae]MBC9978558.1 hypothetical protein [Bradyrhizobium campsiandrae]
MYFIGGGEQILKQAGPLLMTMGITFTHVAPPGSGALVKQSTNALLGVQATALAQLIGLWNDQAQTRQAH